MKRSGMASRMWLVVLCAAAGAACADVGLPDRNLPLEEAQQREFRYQVYQPIANTSVVAMGGRHWIRSAAVVDIPARLLEQVGNADGTVLYGLRGQEAPYSGLWSPVSQDRWAPYLRLN